MPRIGGAVGPYACAFAIGQTIDHVTHIGAAFGKGEGTVARLALAIGESGL